MGKISPLFHEKGIEAKAVTLPGHSSADSDAAGGVTLAEYVATVAAAIASEAGPVILIGHSMGGMVITQVAEEHPDKIESLVYLSAYLPESGRTLLSYASKDPQSELGPGLQVDQQHGIATITGDTMRNAFFNASTAADADAGIARLRPEPLQPFVTLVTTSAQRFGSVKRYYITTTKDQAVGPDLQRAMYDAQPCEKVFTIATDHSSYVSAPDELAGVVIGLTER